MKTLLQINIVLNFGSTGCIVNELGQMATRNDWSSFMAFGRFNPAPQRGIIRIGTDWDLRIHGLQTRLFDRHGLGSKNATNTFIRQIEQIKPDIIHIHNLHGYYLNIEILFNYLANENIPVVWTLHDCWALTGHCAHFDFVGCEKWKSQCNSCPQKTAYPASFLIDRSKKNYNLKRKLFSSVRNITIVPVSHWLGNIVKQSYLSESHIQVINNGVDLEIFSPQNHTEEIRKQHGIGNRFMLMGAATIWSNRKGLDDYIELSKALAKDYIIVLVGLSAAQMKKLPRTIIGIARTENISELVKLYSAADIVLNLSAEETFGLTSVEGFACGTPGIVYNCTASPELITPETGFVVEKGDIQGIINAINTVKGKGKSFYSAACRKRAERLYDKNDRYMDYIKLYESILNQHADNAD